MRKFNIFAKKLLSVLLAVSIAIPTYYSSDVSAADINNIGDPVYTVEKNMAGTDAFVYAYNVLDYGADNTGNNDNTDIFQKLLNKVRDLGGGIVYVPSGRYKITGALKIPKGVTLRGDWTEPTAGQPITSGTILMAYTGRGGDERTTPFIEMEPETGCMELTIWYPEQTPDNITKYSPTIRLGVNNYFGNEYTNVKNVTLLNSYIGILFNYDNGGASPVLNGIYGTPLYRGIDMDRLVDIGRMEWINFSPDYWSGSGMPGAPAAGSSFEDYIYNNATGIVMKRNDWSYTCFVDIDGYNIGYNTQYSIENNGSAPNGNHYKFNLRNCKNGIVFDATNTYGILFNDVTMYNCESGIVMSPGTGDVAQFSNTKITASKYAVNMDKTSTTKLLMNDSVIEKGLVNVDGGTFMCTGTTFNNKVPQIVLGSLGRASLSGNTFTNGKQILNNSIYVSELDNANVEKIEVPEFPDEKAKFQSHMPSNLTLYDVTKAPYYANNSSSHGGGNDCTSAIQNALNDAAANGGGIVFLPSGHYRVNGTLTIPSNVELRGATDLSAVPHGSGAILESYANKGNPNADAFIKISANAGIRGVIVNYPEQTYSLDGNGEYHPIDYPYTMQGLGENIYVINVGIRAATGGLDLDTYSCDNHYVDFLAGHVNKVCVKVGNGTKNGILNNLMFNTIVYGCGQESKYGGFPNSPNTPAGVSNAPVYTQQLRDLEFLIIGDCENETLYNCFPYGAYIGTKFVNEGNGGPQNLISMGLGIDGSRKSMYFESGLTGQMDFINSQIVSLNNDQPITRYFETESNTYFTANLFNTDLWGYPEKSVVMGTNGGTLNLYTANFQFRGYNGALNVSDGSKLNIASSNFNSHSSQFSTGSNNISLVSSIADYTTSEGSSFAQNVANFSNALELDANQTANAIDRTGWTATANPYNENAWRSLDGDLYSQWSTQGVQTAGQWYQVDMGKDQNFDLIVTTLGTTGDVPRAYNVLVSNDGWNWRTVATGENKNVYSVGDQTARYIRIEQTGSEAHWWAVYEFYVLNSSTYDVGEGEEIEPEEEKCDLVVTDIYTQNTSYTGDEAVFVAKVKNRGTVATPSGTKHGLALSVDGTVVNWCDTYMDSIQPGAEVELVMNSGPNDKNSWTVTDGTHTIMAQIDDQNLISESNESNNTYTKSMTFSEEPKVCDLVVTDIYTDKTYYSGEEAQFVVKIKNEGNGVTPSETKHGLLLSVNGTAVNWCDTYFGPMQPGEEVELVMNYGPNNKATWTVPSAGTYTVSALIDDQSLITESNETNNTLQKSVTFTDKPAETTTAPQVEEPSEVFGLEVTAIDYNTISVVWGSNSDKEAKGQLYNVYIDGVKKLSNVTVASYKFEDISDGTHTVKVTAVLNGKETAGATTTVTVEDEAVVSSDVVVEINGYQISTTVEGFRTVYSINDPNNEVVSAGMLYGIGSVDESGMVYGASGVYNFGATDAGKLDATFSSYAGAQSYSMTMQFAKTASFYQTNMNVRAYAKLSNGTYIYSEVKSFTVYDIADYLYQNLLMNNLDGHDYLYNNILSVVDSTYKEKDFAWNNSIVKPGQIKI